MTGSRPPGVVLSVPTRVTLSRIESYFSGYLADSPLGHPIATHLHFEHCVFGREPVSGTSTYLTLQAGESFTLVNTSWPVALFPPMFETFGSPLNCTLIDSLVACPLPSWLADHCNMRNLTCTNNVNINNHILGSTSPSSLPVIFFRLNF